MQVRLWILQGLKNNLIILEYYAHKVYCKISKMHVFCRLLGADFWQLFMMHSHYRHFLSQFICTCAILVLFIVSTACTEMQRDFLTSTNLKGWGGLSEWSVLCQGRMKIFVADCSLWQQHNTILLLGAMRLSSFDSTEWTICLECYDKTEEIFTWRLSTSYYCTYKEMPHLRPVNRKVSQLVILF